MKLRLLILSDLWGFDDSDWIKNYVELLKSDFQLIFNDSCELAGIDKSNLTEKELHSEFINGGIDRAVTKLLKLENEKVIVLAFSIGGTIAWKAALKGLKVTDLYAVSSTRLRYEMKKLNCPIQLIFGEKDPFIPKHTWFKALNIEPQIIKNGQHEIYKEKDVISRLCNQIKKHNSKKLS